ncbi:MAG: nitronate monooxygenase family protein [Dehalococcoidia bacterium]|nr:nitronate monooxygenase family protein [Dehalococcoidia bacterium]
MKSPIRTPLCDLLGIEYPIISAGMGGPAGPALAAAVSNAGGLGVIGGVTMGPERLREAIRKTRALTDRPFGVDLLLPSGLLRPAGKREAAGPPAPAVEISQRHREFVESLAQEWGLPEVEERRQGRGLSGALFRQQVQVVLEEKVPLFAAGLGDPAWMIPDAHAQGMKVLALVGNVKNARRVAAGGVDVVVAQGHEAGGHTGRIGTMALVPQVVDAVAPTPVVAAGGIADGRGLAAALMLGAIGVWCGTAFLATEEAFADAIENHAESEWRARVIKEKLVAATEEDTRVSRVLTGKTARIIASPLADAWERPGAPPTLPLPLQGVLVAPLVRRINRARRADLITEGTGQIAGMIKQIRPAAEVVREMAEQAERLLAGVAERVR